MQQHERKQCWKRLHAASLWDMGVSQNRGAQNSGFTWVFYQSKVPSTEDTPIRDARRTTTTRIRRSSRKRRSALEPQNVLATICSRLSPKPFRKDTSSFCRGSHIILRQSLCLGVLFMKLPYSDVNGFRMPLVAQPHSHYLGPSNVICRDVSIFGVECPWPR